MALIKTIYIVTSQGWLDMLQSVFKLKVVIMLKKIIRQLLGQPQGYVSETDHFLAELRQQYPQLSATQMQEIRNHEQIIGLRDGHLTPQPHAELWRDF